jgi:GMP synthase (glutamine-hydrolysing)
MTAKKTRDTLKFVLIQVRTDQQMKLHELTCFEISGNLGDDQVIAHDLLEKPLALSQLDQVDGVIIGGSGNYSVLDEVPNSASLGDLVKEARRRGLPVLGSCWGAQFIAGLFGGQVVHDPTRKEVGSIEVKKTAEAKADRLFADISDRFWAQAGHNDRVSILPEGALLLAGSDKCPIQAFTFPSSGIYGIQFHPELSKEDLVLRLQYYKENYVRNSDSVEVIINGLKDTPEAASLVRKWVDRVVLS